MSKPNPIMLTLALAAVLALSALSPALAATRHKRAVAASAQSDPVESVTPRARPDWSSIPTPVWQMPNACVSDEGYGRYSSCDSGDSN